MKAPKKIRGFTPVAVLVGCGLVILVFLFIGGTTAVAYYTSLTGGESDMPTQNGGDHATAGATIPGTVAKLNVTKKGKTEEIYIASTKGKVGVEESVDALHAKGQHITFDSECDANEEKWYINMRWPYVYWAWNGTTKAYDVATKPYYATVRVVVHNPRTKKSVVTAICESGPAPWTGSGINSSNPPNYWSGSNKWQRFDPSEYANNNIGRVAGLAPDPFKAIDAKRDDILEYGFADDQTISLGPIK